METDASTTSNQSSNNAASETSNTAAATAADTTDETANAASETTHKRNMIIAMDGSEHSDYALDWFCKHIHREGDRVVLVYVPELNDMLHSAKWSSSVYVFDREVMEAMLKEEQARIRADLDVFAGKLSHHGLGGKVKSVMASKPGEGILKAAEEEKADMIVVGSRGLSTFRRTLMGSVSDYLVHHAHVPVAVCKHPHHWHQDTDTSHPQTKMD